MYWSISIKLIIGMLGVLIFLRMTGKTQMANLTPLDTVNTIVLGALKWLEQELADLGYSEIKKIFCAEYTPNRGFYIIDMDGSILNTQQAPEK